MANAYRSSIAVIALVGPDGVGKSTLHRDVARADPRAMPRRVQVAGRDAMVMDVATPTRTVELVDFLDLDTQAALLGASPFAGVVLVVSAADSMMPGHQASLDHARQLHIPLRAVALTKGDVVADDEMIELVEMEVRDAVRKFGHDGDHVPVVRMRGPNERPHEGPEPARRKLVGPNALISVLAH